MIKRVHLSQLRPRDPLPVIAMISVVAAVLVVVLSPRTTTTTNAAQLVGAAGSQNAAPSGGAGIAPAKHKAKHRPKPRHRHRHPSPLSSAKLLGQLIIARFAGSSPTPSILAAIQAGQVGSVILFGDNTGGGIGATRALVNELQAAAHRGGNPGLLIMTDQEGGLVKRLPGPPDAAASQMSDPTFAGQQGVATAQLLQSAGVNVDLAPVADVTEVNGFMTTEHRTFGSNASVVANAACSFARGLAHSGIAYTLKHFPGLGDAYTSTDTAPVNLSESASLLRTDEAAYRRCGADPLALVMVSSASYSALTGSVPAVLSSATYDVEMRRDGIDAVTISDDFQTAALAQQASPARRAINAGLDLVMYAQTESASANAYQGLYRALQQGSLSQARVQAAAAKVLALKRSLHLA